MGVVAVVLVYRHYTNPLRVRALAEAYLQRLFLTRVTVGDARLSLFRSLELFDVSIDSPNEAGRPVEPAFACRRLQLSHDVGAALWGTLRITSLIATTPTCQIIHDEATGSTNLGRLFRPLGAVSADALDSLPPIELRDARVRVLSRGGGSVREVENLHVSIRGRASGPRHPGQYDLVWHGEERGSGTGYSRLDLRNGVLTNVAGGLPYMSIEAVMLAVNARYDGAGAWVGLLGLDGRVRVADYDLAGSAGGVGVRAARIDLRNASLSVPINDEEHALPRDQRFLLFENVNGSITATAEDIRAEFMASFQGGTCDVRATVRGGVTALRTLDDVDLDLRVRGRGIEFPEPDSPLNPSHHRFVNRWKRLANFCDEFDPCGRFDMDVDVEKAAGPAGAVRLKRAVVSPRGASASCKWFPYRLEEVTGTVEVDDFGVFARDLRGEHDGGVVMVNGWLSAPSRCSEGELWIEGDRVPLDEQLLGGLPDRHAKLVRSFSACGRVDVFAEMHRPGCDAESRNPWTIHTNIALNDISVAYDAFPYRIDAVEGTVTVGPNRLEVRHVRGKAGGGAVVAADGVASLRERGLEELDLVIRGADVPVDDSLINALPFADRLAVRGLHPKGTIDVETSVRINDAIREARVDTGIGLNGVQLRPDMISVAFDDVTGTLRASEGLVRIEGLQGRRADATVRAEGWIHRDRGRRYRLSAAAERLKLDEALRRSLPGAVASSLGEWRVQSPFDLELELIEDEPESRYDVRATLVDAEVTHPRLAIPLEHVNARLAVSGDRLAVSGFSARFGPAQLRGEYEQTATASETTGVMSLTAADVALDATIRGLLPERFRATWDRVAPTGSVDVQLQPLQVHRRSGESPQWTVNGGVRLRDVGLGGMSSVEHVLADVTARGTVIDRLGGLNLSGEISGGRMRVLGRETHAGKAEWNAVRTATGEGRLSIENIRAELYDGTAVGELTVEARGDALTYSLTTSIQGVDLGRLLAGGEGRREPAEIHGATNAHFYLSGSIGDPDSRRGGGKFEVLQGYIHRMPIVLAVWNLLNATIPSQDSFDTIQASFFINGQHAEIESLHIGGGTVTLTGEGEFSLPDQSVDLELRSTNRGGWARVPGLTDVLEGASRELVVMHVTGPISRPVVTVKTMRGVNEEIKQLFRKRPPPTVQPLR